jgi:hypothetical protein
MTLWLLVPVHLVPISILVLPHGYGFFIENDRDDLLILLFVLLVVRLVVNPKYNLPQQRLSCRKPNKLILPRSARLLDKSLLFESVA